VLINTRIRGAMSMRRLCALLGWLLLACATSVAAEPDDFAPLPALAPLGPCKFDQHEGLICGDGKGAARVIADTVSPSRRLALAWRAPGSAPTELPDDGDDIERLVIRLADGAVLARSKGAYWDTGETHVNRLQEHAAWSPDSRLMVESFDSRFSTDLVELHAIGADDTASSRLDLLKIMQAAVERQLKRTVKNASAYEFFLEKVAVDNRGGVRAAVQMWVPKDGPSASFAVTLAVTRKADKLDARVVAMRRTREH
jgi:hypothetical protein